MNAAFCHFVQVRGDVLCLARYMYILMDVLKQTNKIRMVLSILYLRGHRWEFLNYVYTCISLRIVLTLTNDADPDEMGLHCLPKYTQRVISFLASGHFFRLLITFANSLDPDQDRQNVI